MLAVTRPDRRARRPQGGDRSRRRPRRAGARAARVRENTHTRYTACVNRYLIPGLGKKKLAKLTAKNVRTWHTGLRKGELLGLRREDLDLDAGTAAIRRTFSAPVPAVSPRCPPRRGPSSAASHSPPAASSR
ncbi:hypothetical protein GCM10009654_02640 [Streptomyces hebeiensis]|uniref:Integrase SAM-like N-terminal domain-containing protein n=1 Tax=Streptomyces hebeiensis TaxID=229486 RepID=A0ABN1UHC4_9ACTN